MPDPFDVLQQSLGPALAANRRARRSITCSSRSRRTACPSRCCRTTATASPRSSTATCRRSSSPGGSPRARWSTCPADARPGGPRLSHIAHPAGPSGDGAHPRPGGRRRDDAIRRGEDPGGSRDRRRPARRSCAGRPALIEPWNVTELEVNLALALGVPVNGTRPELRPLGFKSAGRRLLADAGRPGPRRPRGRPDHRRRGRRGRRPRPAAPRSWQRGRQARRQRRGRRQRRARPARAVRGRGRRRLRAAAGGPAGLVSRRPHAGRGRRGAHRRHAVLQPERPGGHPTGWDGPGHGDPRAGPRRASRPGLSRLSVPGRSRPTRRCSPSTPRRSARRWRPAASSGASGSTSWSPTDDDRTWLGCYAIEVNLRKGGTTHPYAALRNLVPGALRPGGRPLDRGRRRRTGAYSRDRQPGRSGLDSAALRPRSSTRSREAGLEFDHATGTGVVLHMLSGLAIDGRFGVTAIGRTPAEADATSRAGAAGDDRPGLMSWVGRT